ncbi:hypothetical protein [Chitinimonas lacunae]|uniref:Uncharacterized protein n=1 Tax=Chitinimonas lacunae TaxID=1963018 RepID=A0ABV8MWB1_9NEIS
MIVYSTATRRSRAAAVLAALDAGQAPAKLAIYGGIAPAPGVAATEPPLVVFTLAKPVGEVSDAGLVLVPPAETVMLRTGVATWARLSTGSDAWVGDMSVGDKDSTADLKLGVSGGPAGVMLYAGALLRLPSLILR